MANPLQEEKELYEKIEKEKLSIPQVIWQLMDHHLGNEVYAVSLIAGTYVTGEDKEPIPIQDGEKIIKHCEEIRLFLKKLREATTFKPKDV